MFQPLPLTKKYIAKSLMLCIVFHLCLGISGQSTGRVTPKINLSAKNVTITDVFKAIKSQTGKIVWFMNEEVNADKKVNVNFENASLDEVMKTLFGASSTFTWSFDEEKVILRKKKDNPDNVVISNVEPSSVRVDSVPNTITVSGKVTDEKGSPIIGATVVVKGTRVGTTTALDGKFQLNDIKRTQALIISNVGFITQEINIKAKRNVGNILLKEFVNVLDETQVIAYGTTSQRINTGNISTVKAIDLAKSPVGNPLLAIMGRVPGVFIQQSSGVPGSGVKIIIQGQNSLNNGNDPFYVIDGVPYTPQLLPSIYNPLGESGNPGKPESTGNTGNPLSFINIQDIESIDILKDADATSIYGSRAANGAIIITTKKGKIGKISVNANIQQGWGRITRTQKLLNLSQYINLRTEAYKNDNIELPSIITSPNNTAYDINGFWDKTRSSDWQKILIGGTAKYTNAQGSISGGSVNTQYLVNFGYQNEGTVTPGDLRDEKTSVHFNINSTSENKRLKFNFSGSYVADNNKLALIGSMVSAAFTLSPNAPKLYNPNGTLNWELKSNGSRTWDNPLAGLYQGYLNLTNNLVSNAIVGYQILPGFELKASFGYNKLHSEETNTFPIGYLEPLQKMYALRSAIYNNADITSWIVEPQMTYSNKLGLGRIDALLGTTFQQESRDRQKIDASGFTSDKSLFNIKSAAFISIDQSFANSVILSQYRYNALFGRVNYNIEDKYILNISVRKDGSSRFGKENRFSNFGAIGGAWLFSNENAIVHNLKFLSFGKLKVSYGIMGSDQIGDYSYLNLYDITPYDGNPYQGIIGLQPSADFPNPYLQWEKTKKFSTALDLGFFNDKILISTTYYKNTSSNQLQYFPLLNITGGNAVKINSPAVIQNTGIEMSLNTKNIQSNNFNWSTSFNLTVPKNKLVSLNLSKEIIIKDKNLIGRPIGVQQVYHFLGVDPELGTYIVADKKGAPTSNPNYDEDRTVFIDYNPKLYGGLSNSFSYKGVSLDVLFQFVKQNGSNGFFGSNIGRKINQPSTVLNRWKQPGDKKDIQRASTGYNYSDKESFAKSSDKYFSDASFIRLKNISLSYQLPNLLLEKIRIQSGRIYLQGQNLVTITNYQGIDPENRTFDGLPPLKMLVMGIQLEL